MTLQECKDIIAKKYSIDNFQLTVWMTDEAAELYASQFKSRIAELEKEVAFYKGQWGKANEALGKMLESKPQKGLKHKYPASLENKKP